MTPLSVFVILFVLLLIGALPVFPYSRAWGYYPSGILAVGMGAAALAALG